MGLVFKVRLCDALKHAQGFCHWKLLKQSRVLCNLVDLMGSLPAVLRVLENIMNQQIPLGHDVRGPAPVIRQGGFKCMAAVDKDQSQGGCPGPGCDFGPTDQRHNRVLQH